MKRKKKLVVDSTSYSTYIVTPEREKKKTSPSFPCRPQQRKGPAAASATLRGLSPHLGAVMAEPEDPGGPSKRERERGEEGEDGLCIVSGFGVEVGAERGKGVGVWGLERKWQDEGMEMYCTVVIQWKKDG